MVFASTDGVRPTARRSSSTRTAGSEPQSSIPLSSGPPTPATATPAAAAAAAPAPPPPPPPPPPPQHHPPPPPTQAGSQQSPRRRENVAQPPMLMTSLSGPQYQGLGVALSPGYTATPISTTTLSSPFSLSQAQSQYHPSPGTAARGTSPMTSRHSGGYNAPYNPQEWGPVGAPSPNVGPGNNFAPSSNNVTRQAQAQAQAQAPPTSNPGLLLAPLHFLENVSIMDLYPV